MKGFRELEVRQTEKPDKIEVEIRAYEVNLTEVESNEFFWAGAMSEGQEEQDKDEGDFFKKLRQVSRRIKSSSPGGASSET